MKNRNRRKSLKTNKRNIGCGFVLNNKWGGPEAEAAAVLEAKEKSAVEKWKHMKLNAQGGFDASHVEASLNGWPGDRTLGPVRF